MSDSKSGRKTLLWSVIMSSPGPLVVGLGMLISQSTTQVADFLRRTIEFLAIVLSFTVFCITNNGGRTDEAKKQKYERCTNLAVSLAMVACGLIMVVLACISTAEDKGNVIPGMAIAILGVSSNSIFFVKYRRMGRRTNNKILISQGKLYGAKIFVDLSVFAALGAMLLANDPILAHSFDLVGTVCVSAYLIFSGSKTMINELRSHGVA